MNLILITSIYPFDTGEEFLETEMKYLAANFNRVIIIPVKLKNKSIQTREIPENATILDIAIRKTNFINKALNNIRYLRFLIYGIIEERTLSPKRLRKLIYIINKSAILNYQLNKILKRTSDNNYTVYSYWFTSILLGIFLKNNLMKSVTRLHGGDLYEDRNHISFRQFLYKKIDYLCPISADGKEYINNRYKTVTEKVRINRLGVEDKGVIVPAENQSFTILSCAFLVKVKRIHLIIEALSKFGKERKLKWIHVGTGPLYNDLLKEANKTLNCEFEFLGYVPNSRLPDVYMKYKPNLFVNFSSSEGIPVSMMEAISFGVPILATEVGGVSEIVNEKTGFLLDPDVNANEIYKKLYHIIEHKLTDIKRKSAKDFYYSHFNAHKNYNEFIKTILMN